MDPIDRLIAIEAIRSLKARYCIALDTGDAAGLEAVLARDVVADFSQALIDPATETGSATARTAAPIEGRAALVSGIMKAVEPQVTVHHCGLGDITVESAAFARATWPVVDRLRRPAHDPIREFVGYGFYHETYVVEYGEWRIATIAMSRLRIDIEPRLPGEAGR